MSTTFLASAEARTMTGGDYLVDGGIVAAGAMNHVARTMGLWDPDDAVQS